MKQAIRRNLLHASLFALALGSSPALFAAPDDPNMQLMMTLNTNIYGYQGPTNYFNIYLGSIEENTEVYYETATTSGYVDVDPWYIGTDEDGDQAALATRISLNVSETDNEVRIYGNPKSIDYADLHGCYFNSVVFSDEMTELQVVDLSHNELTSIDLSALPNLFSIDLTDNALTDPEKFVIGANHPSLSMLSIGINDACDPNLDLTNYPQLTYFSARNNYGLREVNTSQCPILVSLVLEVTNISTIDVSKNTELQVLNLSQTRCTTVDLSNNTKLTGFYFNHEGSYNSGNEYKITSIDLSKQTNLTHLDLGGNNLTSIDLSHNTKLIMLYLQRNHLTELDLTGLNYLSSVDLTRNDFTFATLPLPGMYWASYYYQQNPIQLDYKYVVGTPIDLSDKVIRAPFYDDGELVTPTTTVSIFVEPQAQYPTAIDPSLYTFKGGIITINEAFSDPLYMVFHNSELNEYDLETTYFYVKTEADFDAPEGAFSFIPSADMNGKNISFKVGATRLTDSVEYPADVTVIAGDNTYTFEGAITGSAMPDNANISITLPADQTEVMIQITDGFGLTALEMDGILLDNIDLHKAEQLHWLTINNAGLSDINLLYNGDLYVLDLSDNALTNIDLTAIRGDYQKWDMRTVNLSRNNLTDVVTSTAAQIYNLDLSENPFTNFDFKYFTGLKNLTMDNCKLTGEIDLSTTTQLENVSLVGNHINTIVLPVYNESDDYDPLQNLASFDVSENYMTLATLPMLDAKVNYTYAPQKTMEVLSQAPAINLSAQNIVVNGVGTTFVWKYTESNEPVPSTEYSNDGGATVFNETLVGESVYCEMTNPAFPQFDDNPLTTSSVTVSNRPTTLVASFTTTQNGTAQIGFRFADTNKNNAVYIDWRGDGSEYEPYIYEAFDYGSIYRTGTMYANANVKVYTYDDPSDITVFAMNATPLDNLDISPMNGLTAIDVHVAGLKDGSIKFPENTSALWEVVLDGNAFENELFNDIEGLTYLNLGSNQYSSFDFSQYPKLRQGILAFNQLENVKFGGNDNLWQVNLMGNNLSSIDLNGLTNVTELRIDNNYLETIDLSPIAESITALTISGNKFNFETLPRPNEVGPYFSYYDYFSQQPMKIGIADGKADLSSQAFVYDTPTSFLWFFGEKQDDVYYDYYYEEFVGEPLIGYDVNLDEEPVENPEYVVENGVTTFYIDDSRSVICAMTNAEFASLILYTVPEPLDGSGVKTVIGGDANALVDVYNVSGVRLKANVRAENAAEGLAPGLYIIGGHKVLVK